MCNVWDNLPETDRQTIRDLHFAAYILDEEEGLSARDVEEVVPKMADIHPKYRGIKWQLVADLNISINTWSAPIPSSDEMAERYTKWKSTKSQPLCKSSASGCSCDIHLLMRDGCKCGSFAREKSAKTTPEVFHNIDEKSGSVTDTSYSPSGTGYSWGATSTPLSSKPFSLQEFERIMKKLRSP